MTIAASAPGDVRARSLAISNGAIVVGVSAAFLLPSALFAASLRPLPAVAVIAGCCGALILIATRVATDRSEALRAPIDAGHLLTCMALALAIFLLGGETHLVFAAPDWLIRDAVLADLVQHGFPITYRIGDADDLLRAPLGMYMVPALVGRGLGLFGAHAALLAQNALLLGAIFYLLMTLGRGWAHLAILVLFAGVSIVGALARLASVPSKEVPFWLHWGLDSWHPFFQFSGSLVQFFWVPNHALPGWWLATLMLLQRQTRIDATILGVSVAGALFWSPLAILPAVPWLLYQATSDWRGVLLARRTWAGLAAALGFVPILVYLAAASSTIAHESAVRSPAFAFWYAVFVAVQLPVLAYLAVVWREVPREWRALVLVNALVLLALPFFHFGPRNDLVMRGSIASLAIVAFVFGAVVVDLTKRHALAGYAGWVLVAAATPSAAVEIGRALATPSYAVSDCTLMEASAATGDKGAPSNYVAPAGAIPPWLMAAPTTAPLSVSKHACWPDLVAPRYLGLTYSTVSKP